MPGGDFGVTYDGQVADEHGFAVMGGNAEGVTTYLRDHYTAGTALDDPTALTPSRRASVHAGSWYLA